MKTLLKALGVFIVGLLLVFAGVSLMYRMAIMFNLNIFERVIVAIIGYFIIAIGVTIILAILSVVRDKWSNKD